MKKKLLAMLLAVVMCLTLLTIGAMAVSVEVVVEPTMEYDYCGTFSEGLVAVGNKNGEWGFIDETGKVIIPLSECTFDYTSGGWGTFSEGLITAYKGTERNYIDKSGKTVIFTDYDVIWNFSDGLALVTSFDNSVQKCGFIDKTGKLVVPQIYDGAYSFSNGLAVVFDRTTSTNDNGTITTEITFGYIDTTGKLVVPIQYDDAFSFSEGLAAVCKNGKWGFIDEKGKIAIPFEYDIEDDMDGCGYFKDCFR